MNKNSKSSRPDSVVSQGSQRLLIPKETQRFYDFGLFRLDVEQRELFRDSEPVALAPKIFDTLLLLVRNKGRIIEKEELMKALWPDSFVEESNLPQNIFTLRRALGEKDDGERFIETIPRRGYRFIAFVSNPFPQQSNLNDALPAAQSPEQVTFSERNASASVESLAAQRKTQWSRYVWPAVAAMLLIGGAIFGYLRHRRAEFRFTPKGTIVIADFVNSTGESVFDEALKQGVNVGLEQSPMIQVLPDEKSEQILKQMGRSAEQPVTGRIAIELCQRTGGQVAVQGSISSIGTTYLIGLTAIRCDSGEPIAHEQVKAKRKEDVIDALGEATAQLRVRLGESLAAVQKYDAPLQQATTSSLEALKAYGRAVSTQEKLGDSLAIPFFERAIQLDPNFALAYGDLAAIQENQGEAELARQNATKAYALRDRVTEFERLSIESWYYTFVTGDLEKATEALEIKCQTYPQASRSLNDLGEIYGVLGLFEKEVDIDRESLRTNPLLATTNGNLAVSLMALGRVEEARGVLAEAGRRNLQSEYLLQVRYWQAFLRGDTDEMRQLIAHAHEVTGAESVLLSEQANTEAYFGHFARARELTREATNVMQTEGQNEAAGLCFAQAAVREVEVGETERARNFILKALNLTHNKNVTTLAALVMAGMGEAAQARSFDANLDKKYPVDTFVQKYWLPVTRAEVELRQNNAAKAVSLLSVVEPLDSAAPEEFSVSTLYPAYVRGQAYLLAGNGESAAAEFQKLLDHPGMVLNFPLGALARLGLARALRLVGNNEAARKEYSVFFALWRDCDPDLPIFHQAQTEAARTKN